MPAIKLPPKIPTYVKCVATQPGKIQPFWNCSNCRCGQSKPKMHALNAANSIL